MIAIPDTTVESVYTMKTNYLMEIRFSDHSANKIKEKGIYLLNLFIAPWQIEFERFMQLKQCLNYYGYGHLKGQYRETKKSALGLVIYTESTRTAPKMHKMWK